MFQRFYFYFLFVSIFLFFHFESRGLFQVFGGCLFVIDFCDSAVDDLWRKCGLILGWSSLVSGEKPAPSRTAIVVLYFDGFPKVSFGNVYWTKGWIVAGCEVVLIGDPTILLSS